LGALVGPVWSPPPRAPDPTPPTAVWPCLLPAGHSHHRDRGDSRRSDDRSGWWSGGCCLEAQCDVRPVDPTGRAPLSGRRFAGALVTVRRLDGAAPEGNSKAVGDALGKPPSMAKHLSDGPLVCVGFWLPQMALMSASSPALGRRGSSSPELERERALLDRPKPAVPCSRCPASLISGHPAST
jgi:hypothetical protein